MVIQSNNGGGGGGEGTATIRHPTMAVGLPMMAEAVGVGARLMRGAVVPGR